MKGYLNEDRDQVFVEVLVDNTGANERTTYSFKETSVAALESDLAAVAPARFIDVSTWFVPGVPEPTRWYTALAIPNIGPDSVPLPPPATYPQLMEITPAALQSSLMTAQAAGYGARVIDLEDEGNDTVLALISYDGALRNLSNGSPVQPDSWFYPSLTTAVGSLPEQSWNHVALTDGARTISIAPDTTNGPTGYDFATIENVPSTKIPISPLSTLNNDGSHQFDLLDAVMQDFLRQYEAVGASIAIAYGPQMVYTRAYGYADTEIPSPATPNTMFEIASMSKMMTATVIMQAIQNQLKLPNSSNPVTLTTPVFTDIIRPYFNIPLSAEGSLENQALLESITVGEVLSYSAGWSDDGSCGPFTLGQTQCLAGQLDLSTAPTCQQIVNQWLIGQTPEGPAGPSAGVYSSITYCVAEVIVDALYGNAYQQNYQQAVTTNVINAASLVDLAGNPLVVPASDTYTASSAQARGYTFPWTGAWSSRLAPFTAAVDAPYGGLPFEDAMGAYGWKASATALLKWAVSMNQSSPSNQLVGTSTFEQMFAVQATSAGPTCAQAGVYGAESFGLGFEIPCGGDVDKTGEIPGGGGIVMYTDLVNTYDMAAHSCADCITWVALVNTGADGGNWPGPAGTQEYSPANGIYYTVSNVINNDIAGVTDAIRSAPHDLFPSYLTP